MRHTKKSILLSEFKAVKNNWKDIYQWKKITSKGNTELISEMILNDFNQINWSDKGLRKNEFKIKNHLGYCQIQTSITQFTEKRFCRALYNKYSSNAHPLIGRIIDYETPLTEQRQGKTKVNQGDIDNISIRENKSLLFIEAKKAQSNESILKAVLEIFVYTMRLVKFDRIKQLKTDFDVAQIKPIVPCVLTFEDSTSGNQILNIKEYPKFIILLKSINKELLSYKIDPIEFYLIDKTFSDYSDMLTVQNVQGNKKEMKILLNTEINIFQYFPELCGNIINFEKSILKSSDILNVEMLYRTYLTFYREDAISFIVNLINGIQDDIEKYKNTFPKNTEEANKLEKSLKDKVVFIDAYIVISSDYILQGFHKTNLRLVNQYRIKELVHQISYFKHDETLELLVDLYENLRIIQRKDYDGISSEQINQEDEKIIIDALCNYDSPKIIPALEKSLLQGKYNKEKVVKKLLKYKSKNYILKLVGEYAKTENIFISALTNKKGNAKKVIKIIDEI